MKALIVVDMQNDFVSGSLGSGEAKKIVPNVVDKVKNCLDSGDKVFFTRDSHGECYLRSFEGSNLPVEHCITGTHGWEIIDELKPFEKQATKIIDKPTFGSYELVDVLEECFAKDELREIELCGLCTDICVVSNALLLRAKFYETPITVDSSCCAGVTPESHDSALQTMKSCQINVI